jgi:hypothetical protein
MVKVDGLPYDITDCEWHLLITGSRRFIGKQNYFLGPVTADCTE